jgi:CDP-diacylglycerol--glycerol-3-phosphate 3-phosphatidyltransferase
VSQIPGGGSEKWAGRARRGLSAFGRRSSGAIVRGKEIVQRGARAVLSPLVTLLLKLEVAPDHLTLAGLVLSLVAGFAFFEGEPVLGAIVLALAGVCDILDGEVARRRGAASRFGAFLDSTLDRLSEAAVLLGLAGFYVTNLFGLYGKAAALVGQVVGGEVEGPLALVILRRQLVDPRAWAVLTMTSVLALIGSFMVSYTRARAEGLGLECKVGWFERPERMVLLILAGLIRKFWAMPAALLLLALLSFATAAQRVAHVYRNTRRAGMDQLGG